MIAQELINNVVTEYAAMHVMNMEQDAVNKPAIAHELLFTISVVLQVSNVVQMEVDVPQLAKLAVAKAKFVLQLNNVADKIYVVMSAINNFQINVAQVKFKMVFAAIKIMMNNFKKDALYLHLHLLRMAILR